MFKLKGKNIKKEHLKIRIPENTLIQSKVYYSLKPMNFYYFKIELLKDTRFKFSYLLTIGSY